MTAAQVICIVVPVKAVSPNVQATHWGVRAKRAKQHRGDVGWLLVGHRPVLPCTVTLTRIAPSSGLDAHDNARGSLKHVVDGIAKWLGVPDNDRRITWLYADQRRGKPGEYGVEVRIESVVESA